MLLIHRPAGLTTTTTTEGDVGSGHSWVGLGSLDDRTPAAAHRGVHDGRGQQQGLAPLPPSTSNPLCMPTTLTLAFLLHPPCAQLIHSSAKRMLFRRSSPSGSQSSSPSSSSTSLAPRLSLTAIDVPANASNFAAYLADARALVDDFEQGLASSSSSGWKAESAHGVEARVASCKGARLSSTTKELVDEHETWIGRISEHDDVTYDDFYQVRLLVVRSRVQLGSAHILLPLALPTLRSTCSRTRRVRAASTSPSFRRPTSSRPTILRRCRKACTRPLSSTSRSSTCRSRSPAGRSSHSSSRPRLTTNSGTLAFPSKTTPSRSVVVRVMLDLLAERALTLSKSPFPRFLV